jgi:hypothetical protein
MSLRHASATSSRLYTSFPSSTASSSAGPQTSTVLSSAHVLQLGGELGARLVNPVREHARIVDTPRGGTRTHSGRVDRERDPVVDGDALAVRLQDAAYGRPAYFSAGRRGSCATSSLTRGRRTAGSAHARMSAPSAAESA